MTDEQLTAFVASIRSRVGQIKKANNNVSPNSWGQIEVACDKLRAEADTFERALVGDKRRSGSVDSAPLVQSFEPPYSH